MKKSTNVKSKTGTRPVKVGVFAGVPSISMDAPSHVIDALLKASELAEVCPGHLMLRCVERQMGDLKRNPEPKGPMERIAVYQLFDDVEELQHDRGGRLYLQMAYGKPQAIDRELAMRWFVSRQNRSVGQFHKAQEESERFLNRYH